MTVTIVVDTLADTTAVDPAVSALDSNGSISVRSAIQYISTKFGGLAGPGNSGGSFIIDLSTGVAAGVDDFQMAPLPAADAGVSPDDGTAGENLLVGAGFGQPALSVTFQGRNTAQTLLDANNVDRFLEIDPNGTINVTFDSLTVENGNANATNQGVGAPSRGGAILVAPVPKGAPSLTLTNCVITNNHSDSNGGAVYVSKDLNDEPPALPDPQLTISNTTFSSNNATLAGGAILATDTTVAITGSTFSANSVNGAAADNPTGGGAIDFYGYSEPNPTITVSSSTFDNNTSTGDAGAVLIDSASVGGPTTTTFSADTFSNNTASGTAGANLGSGGAINDQVNGTLNIVNTTIAGNSAKLNGGGVDISNELLPNHNAPTVNLTNDTITANHAHTGASGVGGGLIAQEGTVTLGNTIVAGNFSGAGTTTPDDAKGTLAAGSTFNIFGTGGSANLVAGTGNQFNVANPGLGTLGNNGGPTKTVALLAGSPALDAGSNALATAAALTTDQRGTGFPRITDGPDADTIQTADIGAFEADPSIQVIPNQSVVHDHSGFFTFNIGDTVGGAGFPTISSITATSDNQTVQPNAGLVITGSGSTRTLTWTPAAGQIGTVHVTATISASNGQSMSTTFTLSVTDQAPVVSSFSKSGFVGVDVAFAAADFTSHYIDADSDPLANVRIDSLPASGTLKLSGSNVTLNQVIPAAQLGNLTYTPAATGSFTFNWNASDGVLYAAADATVTLNITTSADLSISKSGPPNAIAGDPNGFVYTIVVTNNGPADNTTGFTVSDPLPNGLTFQSVGSTPGASVNGQTITYTNTTGLTNGSAQTFTIHVTLASSASSGSVLQDTATVSSTSDPNSANNTSNTVSTTVQTSADLAITKSAPANAIAGDPNGFDYTVVVKDNGPSDNTGGFTVSDTLPGGLTFQSASSTPGASINGQTITYTNTTGLTSGATQTFTIHVTLASSAPNGQVLSNFATVATNGTSDPNAANNTSSTTSTTVQTQADLAIAKSAPGTAIAGDPNGFDYTVVVKDNGPSDNTGGFTVSDTLPGGLTFQSASSTSGASINGQTITYTNTTGLTSGATQTFTIHVTLASSAPNGQVLSNFATVATNGTSDPNAANNTSSTTSTTVQTQADLAITKSAPGTAIAGDPNGFDYTVVVKDNGPSDNTGGFTVSDTLPNGLTFQSASSTPGAGINGQTITYTNATGLTSGATQTFIIHVKLATSAPNAQVLSNFATVATSGTTDPNAANNTSNTTSTTVQTQADLAITKSAPGTAIAGDPNGFDYTVVVKDNGPSDNTGGFTVSDTLPGGLTFQSASSTPGASINGQTITYTNTTGLTSGATQTFTIHVTLASSAPNGQVLSNFATVATNGTSDPNAANNTSNTTSTTVQTQADLAITKSGPPTAIAGDPNGFDYTVVVKDNGPSDNTGGFTVSDTLPNGLTFQSASSTPGAGINGQTITYTNTTGLTSGATQTFTIHVTLASSAPNGQVLSNFATVATNGTSDPNAANNTSSTTSTTVQTQADLAIAKSAPGTAIAGDPNGINYTLTVTDKGPSDNTGGFTVSDSLPTGFTFQSAGSTAGATVNGQLVSYTNTTGLVSGASATFTIHATISTSVPDMTIAHNTATVATNGTTDPTASNNTSNIVDTTVRSGADLSITQLDAPATAVSGDPNGFNYTLVVTNNGVLNNVGGFTVTDVLPAGLTFQASGSTPGAMVSGQTVSFTNTAGLAKGASQTFVIHVTLASSVASGTVLMNNASVASNGTVDPNPGNNTSNTVNTTAQTKADLAVTNTVPQPSTLGPTQTFTVTVTNSGPSDALNVVVYDTLPANTALVSETENSGPHFLITTGASGNSPTVTFTIHSFAAGASATFTIVTQFASATPANTELTSTATVSSDTTDPNVQNNAATVRLQISNKTDLALSVTASPNPVDVGGNELYTLTITNNGPHDAQNVVLTDKLPSNAVLKSVAQSGGPTASIASPPVGSTGGTITLSIPTLAVGQSATFTILVSPNGTKSTLTNSAAITRSTPDSNPADNTVITVTKVSASPVPPKASSNQAVVPFAGPQVFDQILSEGPGLVADVVRERKRA